jgi:hypothetical protein
MVVDRRPQSCAGSIHRSSGEFPAPDEEVIEVRLSTGQTALVLSPENVLVYRLHEFVGTGHREVASRTISLLTSPDIDEQRLRRRADEERLAPALTELRRLADRVAAGDILESQELHEIASGLRRSF